MAGDDDVHAHSPHAQPFPVLREHYGLCVHCNELLPCRAQESDWAVTRSTRRMGRYDLPGVCPACEEPVTARQASQTFPNTVVPGGPPVTFHTGRKHCRYAAQRYSEDFPADSALTINTQP